MWCCLLLSGSCDRPYQPRIAPMLDRAEEVLGLQLSAPL